MSTILQLSSLDQSERILLPMPPKPETLDCQAEHAVYAQFMRYLRCVPNSRVDIKILSSIQFTADILNYSDAHVAKLLVDLGLRAPRMAFPACFLSYADGALMRDRHDIYGPNEALLSLQIHWARVGEDQFAGVKRQYSLLDEAIYASR